MAPDPYLDDGDLRLYNGDAIDVLRSLPDGCVDMVATSPPFYGLRDYGTEGQIGLEETPDQWVDRLVEVFRECRRVLADHGTLWVEIGDSYAAGKTGRSDHGTGDPTSRLGPNRDGLPGGTPVGDPVQRLAPPGYKQKDLLGQPWMLAFALRADGWYLRSEIIWARPNPMPESVTDRPTKAHSTVFLLSKRPRYFYDADAIREPYADTWSSFGKQTAGRIGNGESPYDKGKPRPLAPPQDETLDGSEGEAPRGPDGRRQTGVKAGDNSEQHRDGERWPNPSGANARSVWTIPTEPTPFAHFATWPQALVRRMILAGCPERGTVLDPFAGSGTTMLVARNHGRHAIGIELNEDYLQIAAERLQQLSLLA